MSASWLNSRVALDPENFIMQFRESIKPGVIPRQDFIQWADVQTKIDANRGLYSFFADYLNRMSDFDDFEHWLECVFDSCDERAALVKQLFLLLGHTNNKFVSFEDHLDLTRNESLASVHKVLVDLGLERISQQDLESYFMGVLIGLETHRRKNAGGSFFIHHVRGVLLEIVNTIPDASLLEEYTFNFSSNSRKKVDFLIVLPNQKKIGVEVNFYTVTGSKPTEIKRSYADIQQKMREVNAHLIWITDGVGYLSMEKSLKDAFVAFRDIYNLQMAQDCLAQDLIALL